MSLGYNGLQPSGFQYSGFQVPFDVANDEIELLGGGGYVAPYQRYREEEYHRRIEAERLAELRRLDDEIARAESERLQALAKLKAKRLAMKTAKKLAALELTLQAEISELRNERVRLMRYLDDEEAIAVLLLSMPLN